MEQALECSVENLPGVFGGLFRFVLVLVAITAVAAVAGSVAAGLGLLRIRRTGRAKTPATDGARPRIDRIGSCLLAGGTALVVPALWLAASFGIFLLR